MKYTEIQQQLKKRFIFFSYLVAFFLTMLAASFEYWSFFSPDYVVIIMLYWLIRQPIHQPFWLIFLVSLLLDTLFSTYLGLHAIPLLAPAYFIHLRHTQIDMLGAGQQLIVVLVLLLLFRLINAGLLLIFVSQSISLMYFLPAVIGTILWPFVGEFIRYAALKSQHHA